MSQIRWLGGAHRYLHRAKKTLNAKRSSVTSSLKDVYMGKNGGNHVRGPCECRLLILFCLKVRRAKYLEMRDRGMDPPWYEPRDFRELRKKPKAFYELINCYVPVVVGVRKYGRLRCNDVVSNIFTVSDVAFAIHALMNNSTYWSEMADYW
jgi:hypothetical protein